jgi:hypothetical protein
MLGPAVAPLDLRSLAVHMLAVAAYHRQAVVLGQGIRMRLRLVLADRLEERRSGQHLRLVQSRKPGQRMLSSSSLQLPVPGRHPVAVSHPVPGHIAGRPGKGWPLLLVRGFGQREGATLHAMCIKWSRGVS